MSLCFSGCRKGEEKADAASRLRDPALYEKLGEIRHDRNDLVKARNIVVKKMTAMIDAKLAARGVVKATEADLAAVKAELEKDPEWQSLYTRCTDVNTAIQESLAQSQGAVREHVRAAGRPASEPISK